MALIKTKKKTNAAKEEEALLAMKEANKSLLVANIKNAFAELETEVATRNTYMDERDDILYDPEYLVNEAGIKSGFDSTSYNFLKRAVDIHKSQVMGRGFNIVTRYDKEDISLIDKETEEADALEKEAMIVNKKRAIAAANAKKGVEAVIAMNGGSALFTNMAGVASAYGAGIMKKWYDPIEKVIQLVSIESPQLYRAGWASSNFRERDFDILSYQISVQSANKKFGKHLPKGQTSFTADQTTDVSDSLEQQSSRKMVTVIDFAGSIDGFNDNKDFHAMVVGGILCGYETNPDYLPKYYLFQNKEQYRRPWGASDISDDAININLTLIGVMSDCTTLLKKLFPKIKGKGFESTNVPKAEAGEIQFFPMGLDQDMEIMQFQPGTYPYKMLIDEIKEALWRSLGLGRVLIDDPTVSFESNQALMTGMKSTIDIAEDKQNRWKPQIVDMLTDIFFDLKRHNKTFAQSVGDEDILFDIEWPSVLRKEDASYRTMLFNDVRGGLSSFETYLNKIGTPDASEEIDRIRAEMKDPILGAILGGNLGMANQMELQEDQQEDMMKKGMNPDGTPVQPQAQPQTGAPLTTDQNQTETQPASQPGSGAPAVSPEGMAATQTQNGGF